MSFSIITAVSSTSLAVGGGLAVRFLPSTDSSEIIAGAAMGLAGPLAGSLLSPGNQKRMLLLMGVTVALVGAMTGDVPERPLLAISIALLLLASLEYGFWNVNHKEAPWYEKALMPKPAYQLMSVGSKTLMTMAGFVLAFFLSANLINSVRLFWGLALALTLSVALLGMLSSYKNLEKLSVGIPSLLMMFGNLFGGISLGVSKIGIDNEGVFIGVLVLSGLASLTSFAHPEETLEALVAYRKLMDLAPHYAKRPEKRAKLELLQEKAPPSPGKLMRYLFPFQLAAQMLSTTFNSQQAVLLGVSMLIGAMAPGPDRQGEADQPEAQGSLYALLVLGGVNAVYKHLHLKYFLQKKTQPLIVAMLYLLKGLNLVAEVTSRWGIMVLGILAIAAGITALVRDQSVSQMISRGESVVPHFVIGLALSAPIYMAIALTQMYKRSIEFGHHYDEIIQIKDIKLELTRQQRVAVAGAMSSTLNPIGSVRNLEGMELCITSSP